MMNDELDWFGIVFNFEDGRSQKVVVRTFNTLDQDWIELRSAVCMQHEMAPVVALRENANLPVGFLALIDQTYYVMHNAMLRTLDIEEFELPLKFLAIRADHLESMYSSGNDDF